MKNKMVILGILAIMSLSLFACSAVTAAEPVKVSIDDFSSQQNITKEITVSPGDSFVVTLGSNQTTGFSWSKTAQVSDAAVVEQTDHEYVAPASDKLGAAGDENWTFKALKKGTATLYMEYSRPWEGGEKAEWTFTLTVTVK
jgi:inhibitor of cysteine peptidase